MYQEKCSYARLLLLERQEALRTLELNRGAGSIQSDYASCRRSLLQAINELGTILRDGGEEEPGTPQSIDEGAKPHKDQSKVSWEAHASTLRD